MVIGAHITAAILYDSGALVLLGGDGVLKRKLVHHGTSTSQRLCSWRIKRQTELAAMLHWNAVSERGVERGRRFGNGEWLPGQCKSSPKLAEAKQQILGAHGRVQYVLRLPCASALAAESGW